MRSFVPSLAVACGLALMLCGAPGCRKKTPAITAEEPSVTLSDGAKRHRPGIDDTATEVAFGHVMLAVGSKSKWSSTLSKKLNLSGSVGGGRGAIDVMIDGRVVREKEILATDGERITKVKLHYTTEVEVTTRDGKVIPRTSPVEGNTYIVERVGSELVVTTESGGRVSKEEEDYLVARNGSIGKPEYMFAAVPRSIRPGEKIPAMAKALELLITNGLQDAKADDTEIEFLGTEDRGAVGVFAVRLTLTSARKGEPFVMTAKQSGELRIRTRDSWDIGLSIQGSITMTAQATATGGPGISGGGTVSTQGVTTPI